MTRILPIATDKLNAPSHSFLHRVISVDTSSPEQSIDIDNTGNVTIATSILASLLVGGSVAASKITYKSTTGEGTAAGIAHQFTGGTNGGTTIATMLNNGNVGIGTTNPGSKLSINDTLTAGKSYLTIANNSNELLSFRNWATNFMEIYSPQALYFRSGSTGTNQVVFKSGMFQIENPTAVFRGYGGTLEFKTTSGSSHDIFFSPNSVEAMRLTSSGNVGIGTTAPSNQLTQKSTTDLESAPLGSELLSSSNWTSTDWTGDFASGFAHTTGNTTALTNTLAAVNNDYYQIAFTVTGRTAGSFTITFGGVTSGAYTETSAWGPRAISTETLSITPTTDFNGTIVISIKQITGNYSATYAIQDNTGVNSFEIRNSLVSLNNTFIGKEAGARNTTGNYNSANGYYSLYSNTTGYQNTANGYQSLFSNTTGNYNSAQGYRSLYSNTTGNNNSAQGMQSLFSNTTGNNNSAQGYRSLFSNTTGNYNSAQGYQSLFSNTTGSNNSAQGYRSLFSNTTGNYNSAQGMYSLNSNTTGNNNSALGYQAGRYIADGVTGRTTGNYGLYLGANTKASADETDNEIVIGYNAIGAGSNKGVIGSSALTDVYFGSTTPSARLWAKGLTLSAGTASASTAPFKLTSGTLNTTAETGAMEYDGTNLTFTPTGTLRENVFTGARGSVTLTAGTTTTVTVSQAKTTSTIIISPTSLGATALTPYVSTKNNGSFVITTLTAAGTETLDYIIIN